MKGKPAILFLALLLASTFALGHVTPTKVRVRVVSRDAKIVGTHVGGALVTITDLETAKILARGTQLGGTGDTNLIIKESRVRDGKVFDTEGAAYFETVLMLEKPTRVEISAEGPLNFPQSIQRSSKTLWLVPGTDFVGEGIVLELHGFILEIQKPELASVIKTGQPADVQIRLAMT